MSKSRSLVLGALLGALAASSSLATTWSYDYSFDGTSLTTNVTSAGHQLLDNDQVTLDFHAVGGYWAATAGALWAPINMAESGTRKGNLAFTLLAGGVAVASGGYTGQDSQFAHIANFMNIAAAVNFDELQWTFTETAYDPDTPGDTNTLQNLFAPPGGFIQEGAGPTFIPGAIPGGDVPEPTGLLLVSTALMAAGVARRRSISAS